MNTLVSASPANAKTIAEEVPNVTRLFLNQETISNLTYHCSDEEVSTVGGTDYCITLGCRTNCPAQPPTEPPTKAII
jgi:hypothetical protein